MPKRKVGTSGNVYRRKDREGITIVWRDTHGRRRSRMLKTATVTEARQILASEKAKVEKAKILGTPLPSEESFSAWADEFLAFQKARITPQVMRGKLSKAEYVRQQGVVEKQLKPFFGSMKLASIRRSDVIRFIHQREAKMASGTVLKEMGVLRRLLNVAVDLEKISVNPAQRVPLPKAPEGRTRYLTPEEWTRVFTACRIAPLDDDSAQWLQQAAGLAISLGARRGELWLTTVPDVDLHRRQVALRKTKNGKPRTAYINDLAMQVFQSMGMAERKRRGDRGVLFPGVTPGLCSMRFILACRRVGIEDFSFHDLRHTFASHLRMQGADTHDLQKLLGHSDPRMTSRYMHLSGEHLRAASSRMDGVLTLPPPESR
jgi:integrase